MYALFNCILIINFNNKLWHQTVAPNCGTKLWHQTVAPNTGIYGYKPHCYSYDSVDFEFIFYMKVFHLTYLRVVSYLY